MGFRSSLTTKASRCVSNPVVDGSWILFQRDYVAPDGSTIDLKKEDFDIQVSTTGAACTPEPSIRACGGSVRSTWLEIEPHLQDQEWTAVAGRAVRAEGSQWECGIRTCG
jgi:hypothetical protein